MQRQLVHADLLVATGHKLNLATFDTAFTADFKDKDDAKDKLDADIERLAELQDMFYADRRYALLLIFQGMDTAGKDGAIRHVMSGVSPQGVDVSSFKQPSVQELAHDYLWRCAKVLPERGRIGIFNRSYYEELAVVRVHGSLLERERLPPESRESNIWNERYEDIVGFERHLVRNGTLVLKFFLHLSKEEQQKRLLARIDTPDKNWKMSAADFHERAYWDRYQDAYEKLLMHTTTEAAPWYIIPADHKWFTRVAVADVIVERLKTLGLAYPIASDEQRSQLIAERKVLSDKHSSTLSPLLAVLPS
jgi:PPK2 family polyphosphate:nucleotide phosphotransferase